MKRILTALAVALAVALGRLPDAGAHYREVRETSPERAEAAERHIEALLVKATANLQFHRTEPLPGARRKLTLVAAAISLTMMIVVAWLTLR